MWTQLYTIHGQKNGFTVPCVFALLPNKRKETYIRLFTQIKSWLGEDQQLDFSFLSDFEQGAYLAVPEVFPGVDYEGCFFHMSKRLDFHVKQLGLTRKYTEDLVFRIRVKKLAALAFIPVADLIPTFERLAQSFQVDELPLLHYFESTWIGLPVGGTGRRLPPIFPHQMWNVLGRHFHGSTRTTNSLEAFHNGFNALISCQHPTIWKLLPALQNVQHLTLNTLTRICRGDTFRHSSAEATRNRRIITLIMTYNRNTADETLRGIAYNYL